MDRYLVTGGAGFIGSHLVESLLAQGCFVRIIDNFDTGSRETLDSLGGAFELIEGSVADPEAVRRAMRGVDYVLHQAARGSVPRSVQDPAGTHEANITGTLQVLIGARDAGVRRVVCASSSSVYGETPELPKRESMNPSPRSPYALSKLALEHYCRIFTEVYGLETVALRYFNVYGPRQNPNLQYAAVIPLFITQMLKRQPCTIYGDGEQTRDFTYVADCVQANLLACKAPAAPGNVYNIACGSRTSIHRLHSELQNLLRTDLLPRYEPSRPGDIRDSFADITRAGKELEFTPKVSLRQGLEDTVKWFASCFRD
ncbi:MAG TPA: SDR family oxidoreductase [Acidobacteriota bacterium]|nr:SDR family oxidoreductase [Acidobacteriota bacterium]